MHCHEVEPQLVAWHDGELAPSATEQVEEHLADCAHCARRSHRLLAATPQPWAQAPAAVRDRLRHEVDVDRILAEADRLGPVEAPWRPPRWLTEPREVHPVALAAYAALLVLSVGWGWHNWSMRAAPGEHVIAGSSAPASDVIPAEAYTPASYEPGDSSGLTPDEGQQR